LKNSGRLGHCIRPVLQSVEKSTDAGKICRRTDLPQILTRIGNAMTVTLAALRLLVLLGVTDTPPPDQFYRQEPSLPRSVLRRLHHSRMRLWYSMKMRLSLLARVGSSGGEWPYGIPGVRRLDFRGRSNIPHCVICPVKYKNKRALFEESMFEGGLSVCRFFQRL
jgi:hypothetical protein